MKESDYIIALKLNQFPDGCYAIVLKYLDLGDVMKKMIGLNKNLRD